MKSYIFKKEDGGVVAIHPNHKKYGDDSRDFKNSKEFLRAEGRYSGFFEYDRQSFCDLKKLCESRKQLYHDGNEVKIDHTWEHRLMPPHCIRNRHMASINTNIDDELKKNNPDVIALTKMQRSKEISSSIRCVCHPRDLHNKDCGCEFNKHWLGVALENLDKRILKGEPDKPLIRQKLQEKLGLK